MRAKAILATAIAALPLAAAAQLPHFDTSGAVSSQALRGKPAVDVMPGIRRGGLGYPLRYPKLVKGSVRVELGGSPLREGPDFAVDYAGGILYVLANVRDSDSIRVSYRHDPTSRVASDTGAALPLLTLTFGGSNSMTMLLGMGGASRFADGRVMQAQNLGVKNSFSMGNVGLSGLFLVSSQANALVNPDSASPDHAARASGAEGTDLLISQKATANLGGGVNFSADYQNVGATFGAFSMLQASGVDGALAQQLEKEKGLSRMGFGLSGGNPKGISFTNSYRSIDDKNGRIQWQDYGVKTSLFDMYYTSRSIDSRFNRFNDIAEAERGQMKKEKGLDRQGMGGALKFSGSSLKFDSSSIQQADSSGVFRKSLAWDSPWLKATLSKQNISQGFTRSGDLVEGERGQWAKERGLLRQDLTLSIPKGKDAVLASLWDKEIKFDGHSMRASAFSYKGAKFGLDMWGRSSDAGFVRIGDVTAQERDLFATQIVQMYNPAAAITDNDRNWLTHESGLSRSYLRLNGEPSKGAKLSFESFGIRDGDQGVRNDILGLGYKDWSLNYRRTNIAPGFARMVDLLEPERKFYGNQIGLDRTDLGFSGKLGKTELSFSHLGVDSQLGGLQRFGARVAGTGFEVKGGIRKVDAGFNRGGDINDPEKDLLAQLQGYSQYDLQLKYDAFKHVKLSASLYDSTNGSDARRRYKNYLDVGYAPDGKTEFGIRFNSHKFLGMSEQLFQNDLLGFSAVRDFGKIGKVTTLREVEHFGGTQADKPSRVTDSIKYETKLSDKTSLSAERTMSSFADGGYEHIQGYKLGWAVSKRLSLIVGRLSVDRDGTKPDASTMTYGFTYDFGKNMRLGYNWQRDLDTVAGGKHNSVWDLSDGSFAGFTFGGGLTDKGNDGQESSAVGKFNLSNPKPFNMGFIKNVTVSFGYDSQSNVGVWQKENEKVQLAGTIAGSEVGFSYGHVMMPGERRAADRGIRLNLDPSGKKPLQAKLSYKVRTIPDQAQAIIRDYDVSYKLGDKFTLLHKTDNLRELAQDGAPLGTNTQPIEKRSWAIEYAPTKSTNYKFAFEDLGNLQQHTLVRRTNVTVSLFNDTASPVKLTYGVQQDETPAAGRHTRFQYELGFDQKPGPNQTLSLLMGTVNWEHSIVNGQYDSGMTFHLDYQLRF